MKKNLTEVLFTQDRSGSMGWHEGDTIGRFDSTLEKQIELEGAVIVFAVQFGNEFTY